jgi:hypothetical protein
MAPNSLDVTRADDASTQSPGALSPVLRCETIYVGSDSARVSMLAVASAAAGVVFGFLLAALALAPTHCRDLPSSLYLQSPVADNVTYLGVEVRTALLKDESSSGARIVSVFKDSPAEAAGLEQGDVVIGIDGYRVVTASDLVREVRSHSAGDWVMVRLIRAGSTESVVLPAVVGSISVSELAQR